MSDTKVEVDVLRRIYFEHGEGEFLELGPWADEPTGMLELRTVNAASIKWCGSINLSMSAEFAKALGNALLAAAEEMKP